jgi:hypothetical protein
MKNVDGITGTNSPLCASFIHFLNTKMYSINKNYRKALSVDRVLSFLNWSYFNKCCCSFESYENKNRPGDGGSTHL